MRILLAAVLATCGLALAPGPVHAAPLDCPPNCDRIPDSAWIAAASIPLDDAYRWPQPATVAAPVVAPRFRLEDQCASPPVAGDQRAISVAARAAATSPDGQWRLQAQVMHWRGEVWRGAETAGEVFDAGVAALRRCHLTAPLSSPTLTTAEPTRLAAVVSAPGGTVLHQYLLLDPRNSTISELALWSAGPTTVGWPIVSDDEVLEAMATPLCTAYIDSCR
jgi:hypothetical protein